MTNVSDLPPIGSGIQPQFIAESFSCSSPHSFFYFICSYTKNSEHFANNRQNCTLQSISSLNIKLPHGFLFSRTQYFLSSKFERYNNRSLCLFSSFGNLDYIQQHYMSKNKCFYWDAVFLFQSLYKCDIGCQK